jgi:hypothetical protein
MKYLVLAIIAFCIPAFGFCQDITGLWKGTMYNDSTQKSLPYEVYITKDNGKYSGISHSWFLVNGKEYYGIKKVKVRIAKDGKIVIQDASLIENNYPVNPDNVNQLNVLELGNNNNETVMNGPFATNRTKTYGELTGSISIKKVTASLTESSLMQYLNKNKPGGDITVVK